MNASLNALSQQQLDFSHIQLILHWLHCHCTERDASLAARRTAAL